MSKATRSTPAPSGQRATELAAHAAAIRRLGKRVVTDVIEIGARLTDAKRLCGHGHWLPWLDREFGWQERTARNFISVYEASKSADFADLNLPVSALYLLSAPSTPPEARDALLDRAATGEKLTHAEIKQTITATKDAERERELVEAMSDEEFADWADAEHSKDEKITYKAFMRDMGLVIDIADRGYAGKVTKALLDVACEVINTWTKQLAKLEKNIPNGARAIMASRLEPTDGLDFFPTPPWATRALIERVLPVLGVRPADLARLTVWEPACGEGHMAEALAEYFGTVIATDIHDYRYGEAPVDFLDEATKRDADWIITNSPFEEKFLRFALRMLKLARVGVAMFVQLRYLETIERYEKIFRDNPPTLVAIFVERVNLCKGRWGPDGGTATAYAWLVWMHGQTRRPPFWIPPDCEERLTRADDAARFTTHPVTPRPASDGLDLPEYLRRTPPRPRS